MLSPLALQLRSCPLGHPARSDLEVLPLLCPACGGQMSILAFL
jgi:hypothetical protein